MAKSKRIIPDFMLDNPDDSFVFLMPIGLKPDLDEDIGNSYFNVVVKNLTTSKLFTTLIAPEIFFTHFKFQQAYKKGKIDRQKSKKNGIETIPYPIDTRLNPEQYNVELGKLVDDKIIGQLLGWKYTYLDDAKKISCCIIKQGITDLIIPHYAIAVYYYYRSTVLREATLRCDLGNLYYGYDCNPLDASIIVPNYVSEDDAPFIHRFLCQKNSIEAFESIGTYLNAFIRKEKDKNPEFSIDHIPIKAKFPQRDEFLISTRSSIFYHEGHYYHYIRRNEKFGRLNYRFLLY
jgi:hypothetical protein